MKDETRDKADELMDAIERVSDVELTTFELLEYKRGDPTAGDSEVTGAEINMTAYISFDVEDNSKSDFRYNP